MGMDLGMRGCELGEMVRGLERGNAWDLEVERERK